MATKGIKEISLGTDDNYLIESTLYTTVKQTSTATVFTADLDKFQLFKGVTVAVKFGANVTNNASATLNINGTGAKAIYYEGAAIAANKLQPKRTYIFTYNDAQWELIGDLDTNTQVNYGNITTSGKIGTGNNLVVTSSGTVQAGATISNAISTQTTSTKFLREDGTWATPSYTTNIDEKVSQIGSTDDKNFPIILKNTDGANETSGVKYSNNTNTDVTKTKPFTFNPSTGTLTVPQIKIGTKDDNMGLFPNLNNWNQIGSSSLYWYRAYINNYYGDRSHITNWDAGKNIGTAATSSTAATKGSVNFYNTAAAGATQTKTLLEANTNTNSNITITLPNSTGNLALVSDIPTKLSDLEKDLTYSDFGAAAASHGTHVTTATIKSALGIVSPTAKKFLKDTGDWVQVAYTDLTGVPTSFTPAEHDHNILYPLKTSTTITKGKATKLTFTGEFQCTVGATTSNSHARAYYKISGYGQSDVRITVFELADSPQVKYYIPDDEEAIVFCNQHANNVQALFIVMDYGALPTITTDLTIPSSPNYLNHHILTEDNYKYYAWARPSSITTDQVLVSNGTAGETTLRAILNNTSATALGWNNAGNTHTDNLRLVDVNTLAYWNGAYSGTSSNLAYYKGGAFGTMAKEAAADYAKLASPTFTGTPKAPTAADGTNTTQIATTAFVMSQFKYNDAMIYKGVVNANADLPATHYQGWTYKVATAGTYAGIACEIGDMIICNTDGTSANNAHWNVIQTNIDGAVIGPAAVSSGRDNSIVRFDGETGKIIQDSLVTIDDNGNMSFGTEKVINFRMNRKKADGGGWDCPYINWYDNANTQFARIGVYGQQDTLNYIYLGAEAYNSTKNLKILPSGRIRVLSLDFNGTGSYGGETQPIYWKDGVPVACTSYGNASVNYASSAGTATTLQNARTLWGQSFNGSANITGNMTDVGPQLRLPTEQTNFAFLTSTGGAATSQFGRLGLADSYSTIDLNNYRLDVNGNGRFRDVLTIYKEGTTSQNLPAKITFTTKDTDKNTTNTGYIAYYHDHATTYNGNLVISSGGGTFIGAGESAASVYSALGSTTSTENLYLSADGSTYIYSNADTAANRIGFTITTGGHLLPQKAETNNTKAQDLGSASAMWRNLYLGNAGEVGVEVDNTQTTNPNKVAFIVGSSGNGGIYSRKHSKWIVYADASGNVVLNGNANTATKLSNTPNTTTTFLRGDNVWTNTLSGKLLVYNSGQYSNEVYSGGIELREYNLQTTTLEDNLLNAPGITFHWGGHVVNKLNIRKDGGLYWGTTQLLHTDNYTTYTPKATTTTNLGIDAPGTNAIGYVSGLTKAAWNYQQTDGSLYTQFYSTSWISEIFQDYRTGQLSVRGKNNGTWQSWRRVLDETNGATILGLGTFATKSSLAWNEITQSGADSLGEGSNDLTDNSEILTSYASNNGFADTNAKGVVYRRDAIHVYNYIKGKTDSVYAPKSTVSCTAANVKSALGTDSSTINQWLNKKGEWSTPTAEQIGAAAAVTGGYLPLSGGTMTGALNFANNIWNTIGDDAYLGDINKAGHIGIQGKNGNTGLFFTTYNQTTKTTGGAITWDGTKFSITSTTAVDASISGNAATTSKISATLNQTAKTYLLGTQTTITATAANVSLTGDTGVYLTTTPGELSAYRYSWHYGTTEQAYTLWNNTDQSIDFIFI